MNANRKLPELPGIVQRKTVPKAPPVYRPQPVPKVLQRKTHLPNAKTPANQPSVREQHTTPTRTPPVQPKARALPDPPPKPMPMPIGTSNRTHPKPKTPAPAIPVSASIRTAQLHAAPRTAAAPRTSRVIQREPLAVVKIRNVTHLRKSNQGLSLAHGQNYAVVRSPERVTIDLGDAWQSHLGRNQAVSPEASHTWYRVVEHGGRPIREDVYIREGSFREVSRPPSQMGHVTVLRFCDVRDPKTLWSHKSKAAGQQVVGSWATAGITGPHVLGRASAHMDGAIDDSPFVSVALEEQSLLRYGFSGGLSDIVFGADKREQQAPHIAVFSVPQESLISPELIKERLRGAGQMMGLARAEKETERLYYGDDISQHLVRFKNNPYRREHLDQIIRDLTPPEPTGPEVPFGPEIPSLDMGKIKRKWSTFLPILQEFLARIGRAVDNYPGLNAEAAAMALRNIFRKQIEPAIEAVAGLNDEWIRATREYR